MEAKGGKIEYDKHGNPLNMPDYMATATQITPTDHLNVQEACQKYVDAAISKTCNVPVEIEYGDFKGIYWDAWERGLKGCTTYRPSGTRGAVLTELGASDNTDTADGSPKAKTSTNEVNGYIKKLPQNLPAQRYKFTWNSYPVPLSYYVHISDYTLDGKVSPVEIFIRSSQPSGADEWISAVTRLGSAHLRHHNQNVEFLIEELSQVESSDGETNVWVDDNDKKPMKFKSRVAVVGEILKRHFNKLQGKDIKVAFVEGGEKCPRCKEMTVVDYESCKTCRNPAGGADGESCGWSKC